MKNDMKKCTLDDAMLEKATGGEIKETRVAAKAVMAVVDSLDGEW